MPDVPFSRRPPPGLTLRWRIAQARAAPVPPPPSGQAITTEAGDPLLTEAGEQITTE